MPTIARFSGMTFRMYFLSSEHNPPHIHVFFGNFAAAFDINTCEVLDGIMPLKEASIAKRWIAANKSQLLTIWEAQELKRLDP